MPEFALGRNPIDPPVYCLKRKTLDVSPSGRNNRQSVPKVFVPMNSPSLDKPVPFYLLFLLALVLWGGEYVRRDLWSPDEARYALISREMRQDSHWLVPYRQGEFYTHKPPLIFWLTNAGVAAGFPERVAARLPSFLGALMALWAITRLAARWFDSRTSWWVALLLPTSYLFWNKGGFGQIDALLCGLEMMGLYLLFSSNPAKSARRIPAYLFFGLAIIAKGPVGLLVPMAAYAAASFAAGDGSRTRGWHWLWGPLLALTIPGLWLLAAWHSGAPDGFFNELIFKQNAGRVTGEFGGHPQPWYYYLLYFPADFLPWTILLPLSIAALMQRDRSQKDLRRLLGWIVAVILLFSLSASKRNLYILLAHPAAALLVAAGIPHWTSTSKALLRRSRMVMLIFAGIIAAGLLASAFPSETNIAWQDVVPGGAALIIGIAFALRAARTNPDSARWLAGLALALLITFASIGAFVYPRITAAKTPHQIIPIAQQILKPGQYLIYYKQQGEIVSLYADRPGRMADNEEELRKLLAAQPANIIVTSAAHVDELLGLIGTNTPVTPFPYGGKKDQVWLIPE